MSPKSIFMNRLLTVLLLAVLLALPACATGSPQHQYHSFTFDGWSDKWATQVDLLEYSYGDQYQMVRRKARSEEQTLGYSSGVTGQMPVGEFLYVRWRIKETGEVIENRVDLRGKLATNMFQHKVTFVIDGKQLYVYLVTSTFKKTDTPPILKTYLSRFDITYEIYPNNTYKP